MSVDINSEDVDINIEDQKIETSVNKQYKNISKTASKVKKITFLERFIVIGSLIVAGIGIFGISAILINNYYPFFIFKQSDEFILFIACYFGAILGAFVFFIYVIFKCFTMINEKEIKDSEQQINNNKIEKYKKNLEDNGVENNYFEDVEKYIEKENFEENHLIIPEGKIFSKEENQLKRLCAITITFSTQENFEDFKKDSKKIIETFNSISNKNFLIGDILKYFQVNIENNEKKIKSNVIYLNNINKIFIEDVVPLFKKENISEETNKFYEEDNKSYDKKLKKINTSKNELYNLFLKINNLENDKEKIKEKLNKNKSIDSKNIKEFIEKFFDKEGTEESIVIEIL